MKLQSLFTHKKMYFNYFFIILFTSLSINCEGDGDTSPPIPDVNDPPTKEEIPVIPHEQLLTLVQETTFKYFWDCAESNSGMARERLQDGAFGGQTPVTTGGSGFGISSFPIAVERGWKSRGEVIERLNKILTFLEAADTYHGVFSHWYYGDTGVTKPFSEKDNGGDIVETAFLIQGLLICRQYFSGASDDETEIRSRITAIWEAVDWNWYTQGNKSITWHWSPNYEFALNHTVSGWNEALIVYVLAAASPTSTIDKETYEKGWARNGNIRNTATYYGYQLPLGEALGGPLFFAHYSFIGLNPTGLSDQYAADYFQQNKAHTLINYEYCKANPKNYVGYSENNWGLTASDNNNGYSAHSPTNDLGIITPTAALSSFPYTPAESTKALEYFYYDKNTLLWGPHGFYDAFSEHHNWYSDAYLAIDQGPIIAMIENHRTQLLWNLFMADQEIKDGLTKLGFTSPNL